MGRYRQIARRVAVSEAVVASLLLEAKDRPSDLFGALFFDIREKAKKLKDSWEEKAGKQAEQALRKDLKARNVPIVDFKLSLGKYRGSRFVTSAKLSVRVKTEKEAQNLLKYLQSKYSPKFKLKNFNEDEGVASYNVR